MTKISPSIILILIVVLISFSCKKSPANIMVGEYQGTYTRDSVIAGNCTTKGIEVNPLTVNLVVTPDSMTAFTLVDVAVEGGDQPYVLSYNGIEGSFIGSVTETDMSWTLMSTDDTISFIGVKQ